jgi:hypothetical protein
MAYDKEEPFNLPVAEKYELVMDLMESHWEPLIKCKGEEIKFAKERLKLHRGNPSESIGLDELKRSISEKYGF